MNYTFIYFITQNITIIFLFFIVKFNLKKNKEPEKVIFVINKCVIQMNALITKDSIENISNGYFKSNQSGSNQTTSRGRIRKGNIINEQIM